jgi:hypothetical protein
LYPPPPLKIAKGAGRLPILTLRIPVELLSFLITIACLEDSPVTTFLKLKTLVLTEMLMTGVGGGRTSLVPVIKMVAGLASLPALCVMERVPENDPAAVGENRTSTDLACPGARLKEPCPLETEKGEARVPTLPVKVPVELLRLEMVIV